MSGSPCSPPSCRPMLSVLPHLPTCMMMAKSKHVAQTAKGSGVQELVSIAWQPSTRGHKHQSRPQRAPSSVRSLQLLKTMWLTQSTPARAEGKLEWRASSFHCRAKLTSQCFRHQPAPGFCSAVILATMKALNTLSGSVALARNPLRQLARASMPPDQAHLQIFV